MAPERFAGRCDARSDVYALGLTLYELLALRPAYSAADRHELMRRVMNEEPERLRKLVPHLPRDLETIVEKAIGRDPAERYPTAAALAVDLQLFLDDRPIRARRAGASEQVWRWARRNPVVASLAAGLLLALVCGLIGVTWKWREAAANLKLAESGNRKAQARFRLAMEAVRAFTTGASEDVILKEKALEGLRKKLLGQSQVFYERLKGSLEGETDRASRSALAEALVDAGALYAKVDAAARAEQAYRAALALREALARERPGEPEARRDLGRTRLALAGLLASPTLARYPEARAEVARARDVLEPLARERPHDGGARKLLADCESLDGSASVWSGREEEGREVLERARAIFEALIQDDAPYTLTTAADGPSEYRRGLADVLSQIALSWNRDGDDERAQDTWERQWRVLEDLTAGPFADDEDWLKLAHGYRRSAAMMHAIGEDVTEPLRRAERASEILQGLADANPTVASFKQELASALEVVGENHLELGHAEKARRYVTRSLVLLRSLPPEQRGANESAREAMAENILARCDLQDGRLGEALGHVNRSLAICEESARTFPDYIEFRRVPPQSLFSLAFIEAIGGRPEDALRTLGRQQARARAYLHDHPRTRLVRYSLISALLVECYLYLQAGRGSEAARACDRAATEIESLAAPLNAGELFLRGGAHACVFVLGRPAGPGRPAEPPGLRSHSDRAVADILESARRGIRNPVATAMAVHLLPDRPELRLLLLDLAFPEDPFATEPGPGDDGSASDARGIK
jgi:tetratricopeptide (TPR) repeat protein